MPILQKLEKLLWTSENIKIGVNSINSRNNLEEIGVLLPESKGKELIYINTNLYDLLKKGT